MKSVRQSTFYEPLAGMPSDTAARLPNAAALAQEADTQLRALLEAFRQQAAGSNAAAATAAAGGANGGGAAARSTGPLLITLIKALSAIGVQRPGLLGRVLPALMHLAKEVRRVWGGVGRCGDVCARAPGQASVAGEGHGVGGVGTLCGCCGAAELLIIDTDAHNPAW